MRPHQAEEKTMESPRLKPRDHCRRPPARRATSKASKARRVAPKVPRAGWITAQSVVAALCLELPSQLDEGNGAKPGARRLRITVFPEEFTLTDAPMTPAELVAFGHNLGEPSEVEARDKAKARRKNAERKARRDAWVAEGDDHYYLDEASESLAREQNGARSRARLMRKARMLRPDRMFTLTSSGPVYSRRTWHRITARFFRLLGEAGHKPNALIVDELHQGGGINHNGWHSHFAVRGFFNLSIARRCWHKALLDCGHIPHHPTEPGGIHLSPPMEGKATQPYRKLVAYLGKYLAKTFHAGDLKPGARRWRKIGDIAEPEELVTYITAEQARELDQAMETLSGCSTISHQVELSTGDSAWVYMSEGLPTRGLLWEIWAYPLSERRPI